MTAATVISAGTAPCRLRSPTEPLVISRPSTMLTASRLTACAAPRASSADTTIRAARRSAVQASRKLDASRDGSRVTIARKFNSRNASECCDQPMS